MRRGAGGDAGVTGRPPTELNDLVAAAIGFLPRATQMPAIERAARVSEMQLLAAAARPLWRDWPQPAMALFFLCDSIAQGRRAEMPVGAISPALEGPWHATDAAARQKRIDQWRGRADIGDQAEGR